MSKEKLSITELKAIASKIKETITEEREQILTTATVEYSIEDYTKLVKLNENFKKAQKAYQKVQGASIILSKFKRALAKKYIINNKNCYVPDVVIGETKDVIVSLTELILTQNIPTFGYEKILQDLIIRNCTDAKNLIATLQEEYIKQLQEAAK